MANETFTTKSGRQIPVPVVTIPSSEVTTLMRLQEDFIARGEHLSLLGVLLDVLDKGRRTIKHHWKHTAKLKNDREFSKAIAPYMVNPAKYAEEITKLAVQFGKIKGTPVEMSSTPEINDIPSEDELELTDEQLDAATAPDGAN